MALTSKLTPEKVELPHEEGEWIEIKHVPWQVLRDARAKRQARAMAMFGSMSAETIQAIGDNQRNGGGGDDEDGPDEYDREILIRASITTWSYDEPVTGESIADLDDETVDVVYKAAVKLNTRSKSEGEASTPS